MEILMALIAISLILVAAALSLQAVFLMKILKKPTKKISTNRSVRGSRSKEPDNDGDISGPVQAIIEAAQHNTLADNPEEAQEELSEQQKKELEKKERIRLKQIEDAIIASTQKTKDALDKTLQEIMTGVEVKDGKN